MNKRRWDMCAVLLLLLSTSVLAADRGSGHFRKGEVRLALKYAVAVLNDDGRNADEAQTYVFLSDVPLDAGKVAAAFNPGSAVEAQLGEGTAGYVRVCITPLGDECGLYFSHNKPNASFNSSGSGEFTLEKAPAGRLAGRWLLAKPSDFFGETYDFDLNFDVAITPAPGKPLPVDGGAPAKAYRVWIAAVVAGDLPVLRGMAGESVLWRLNSDDKSTQRSALKDLRDGSPVAVTITRGRVDGDAAVLWVEGRDRDDILRRGRVEMQQTRERWRFVSADLSEVDE